MPLNLSRSLLPALFLACLTAIAQAKDAPPASAQQPTLQALLNEVRLLRAALERSNLLAPKIQIALARMQFEEERVRTATRRVETAHDEVSNAQHRRAELTDRLKNVESAANQAVDPNTRKQFENEVAAVKAELERFAAIEAQYRAHNRESM